MDDAADRDRRTTLVVDGSASSIFYTAALLRYLKYTVRTAQTGESALQMIAYTAPSVVITEAVLPKMSGVTLLEQIKSNPSLKFIPVIINTSDKKDETREKCRKAGCADYFIKPAEPEQLYRAIQTASEKTPRKHIRIKTALKARIETKIEEVTMLSEGGLFIQTPAPLPVNTEVSLTSW